jgi:RNA-directed DNA polymerase
VNQWRRKEATGDVIIVRYADDAVLGFQHRYEAERFLEQLRERLGKFGLDLNSEKTRLIEFGRFAAQNRKKRGQGKPETFTFLGFIHMCGTSYKAGYFAIPRKTIGKRMAAKLKGIKAQLQRRKHESTADTLKWLQSVVRGYFRYHAVPGNEQQMRAFRKDVLRLWLHQLRRRSQRSRWTWERFLERLAVHIPFARTEHPYPNARFDATHPR